MAVSPTAPVINDADFLFLREMVLRESAIVLEVDKMYLVEARMTPIVRALGLESIEKLVHELRKCPSASSGIGQRVVEAMTTNETSFYRDVHPFEALRQVVLPDLIEKRKSSKTLSLWCAAASSGQEPYSVAMLLREHFPMLSSWQTSFVATELSTEILAKAREGKYSQFEINRGLPATLMVKYFTKDGLSWKIKDDLRAMIDFRPLNLAGAWAGMPQLDIVFLRNVLIYFDVATKKTILSRVRQLLREDGYLFLGGAETTLNLDDNFERLDFERSGCYRLRKK